MEKKEVLERLELMKDDFQRVKRYATKQVNLFLGDDADIWHYIPVCDQVVFQNYYSKLLDLMENAGLSICLMKQLIESVDKLDEETLKE